jgi:small multidrug resistance pump
MSVVAYGLLFLAITAEIAATTALKVSEGMSRIGPMTIVVGGYGVSLWLLSLSLERFPLALVYSLWAGLGMIGTALIGWRWFGEPLGPAAPAGIALIVAGVVVLATAMGRPSA